jgi:hypothetical protein
MLLLFVSLVLPQKGKVKIQMGSVHKLFTSGIKMNPYTYKKKIGYIADLYFDYPEKFPVRINKTNLFGSEDYFKKIPVSGMCKTKDWPPLGRTTDGYGCDC